MTIEEKRELLYQQLRWSMLINCKATADMVTGKEELSVTDDVEAFKLLRERLTSEEEIQALQSVIFTAHEGLLHSMFCMFDGVSYIDDTFTPAIVDWETKENLAKEDITYHDEFIDYLLEHKKTS